MKFLRTEADTLRFGAELGAQLKAGDVVYLAGDLGAGKSTLARGLIRSLTSPDQEVPSPTFTLVQTYEGRDFDIAHFDLYRLETPEDIYETGLFDMTEDHLCLIEWPERLGHLGFDTPRIVRLTPYTQDGVTGRLAELIYPQDRT